MTRWRFMAAVAVECGVALALTASAIGRDSLWQDEGATWDASGRSLGDTFRMIRDEETNGSLFHLLVKGCRAAFGDAEWVLRLPSMIAVTGLVAVVAALANTLFGRRVALVAGAVIAVHGSTVHYGRDGRTYALLVLLVAASMLGLVLDRRAPGRWPFALWVLAGAASFYVHLFAALALACQAAVLLRWFGPAEQRRRRLAGFAAIGALMAPLGVVIVARGELEGIPLSSVGPGTVRDVAFLLSGGGWPVAIPAGAAFAWAAWSVLRRRDDTEATVPALGDLRLLLLWAVAPTVVAVVISLPERIFEPRYMLPSLVPLVLLVCWVATRDGSRRLPVAAVVVAVALVGGASGYGERKEDWRGLTTTLLDEARPGDAVVFLDELQVLVVEYYLEAAGFEPPAPTELDAVVPATAWGDFHIADWDQPDISEAELACAVAGRSRVWVVELTGIEEHPGRYGMLAFVEEGFGPGAVRFDDGDVTLHRFDGGVPAPTPAGC